MSCRSCARKHGPVILCHLLLLAVFWAIPSLAAAELRLAIHPVLPKQRTLQTYQPLADYLSRAIGQEVRIVTNVNFFAHWQAMQQENYELVLDGPHLTAYRNVKMGYTVLAKLPGVVSYSLVTNEDNMVLEPEELIGKTIATTAAPAVGALRLLDLFPNPARQPDIAETPSAEQAADLVASGKVEAAMIPAPMASRYSSLITVINTEQIPAPGFSVAPSVSPEVQQKLREALLNAPNDAQGSQALEKFNVISLEPADSQTFAGMEVMLQDMWGY